MPDVIEADICVIGAGSGGLSVVAGASQMGASTVLIEKGKMGGDCLNYGCVPSKALLAAAHAAQAVRTAPRFGVEAGEPTVVSKGVYAHVHGAIAAIAPVDSQERYEGLGVRVVRAVARFTGPREVEADGVRVRARRFVVATGSTPVVPPLPGLDKLPYLTNETIFYVDELPRHLIVLGGGPIGIEMAQAHRQLGAEVTVLERSRVLPRDDPELADILRRRLIADGIDLREGFEARRVEAAGSGVRVHLGPRGGEGGETAIEGSHLLVAVGRRPTVEGLDLDAAGIDHSELGIQVDARLRTTNRKVYAIGDVTGGYQFTHMAGYDAGIVIRNALFRLPAKVDHRAVPWVTYTDPELAQVGLTEAQAREQAGEIRILRWPYAENDRAQAEGETEGLVKVVTTPSGKVLGAGIVGHAAGESIQTWILAISQKIKIGAIAGMIAPYPTRGEVNKRAAGSYYTPKLFSDRTRKLVCLLLRLG